MAIAATRTEDFRQYQSRRGFRPPSIPIASRFPPRPGFRPQSRPGFRPPPSIPIACRFPPPSRFPSQLGPASLVFEDDMAGRPITTGEWQVFEMVADVPNDADRIDYGLALVGAGRAWLVLVSLEVVGE
jgi:hypothetical protein